MARFLSPDWLAELDAAIRSHPRLGELTSDVRIVVEQRVGRDVVYHLVLDHGRASVEPGPATEPTVTFSQDAATARSIAEGRESAQRAFMSGQLRVGGDLQALSAHQNVLAELGDVFLAVRAGTDFGPPTET